MNPTPPNWVGPTCRSARRRGGADRPGSWRGRGFTLLELMIVVCILGIILAMGVPTLYGVLHKTGFRKTMSDFTDMCKVARARAILQGVTTQIVFQPEKRRCELVGGKGSGFPGLSPESTGSMTFGDATIEMLDVNMREYKDAHVARVHFYPNGTCDELTLILHSTTEPGQWRKISLDMVTALASVSSNPNDWLKQ